MQSLSSYASHFGGGAPAGGGEGWQNKMLSKLLLLNKLDVLNNNNNINNNANNINKARP